MAAVAGSRSPLALSGGAADDRGVPDLWPDGGQGMTPRHGEDRCRRCGIWKPTASLIRSGTQLFCPLCAFARVEARWRVTPGRPTNKQPDRYGLIVEDVDRRWFPALRKDT